MYFTEKKVGATDAIHGELDSIPFYLYGMKEPNYVMQIMATYRTLEEKGQEKNGTTLKAEIKGNKLHISQGCTQPLLLQGYD